MMWRSPTYRLVDGERIDGAWCHVWRRAAGGSYFVEDLVVFADGAVRCGSTSTDLNGLRRLLESGHIAVADPAATAPAGERGWRSRAPEPLTPEGLLLDAADQVAELAGRPTAADRCWAAVRGYLRDPSEANRRAVRAAYLAVPPHRRVYVLGDMDALDRPLRILAADPGTVLDGDGPLVTEELRESARAYFARTEDALARERRRRAVLHADDPERPPPPAIVLHETVFPRGLPERPGTFALRNARADRGGGRGLPLGRARLLGAVRGRGGRPDPDPAGALGAGGPGTRRPGAAARRLAAPAPGRDGGPAARQVHPAPRARRGAGVDG